MYIYFHIHIHIYIYIYIYICENTYIHIHTLESSARFARASSSNGTPDWTRKVEVATPKDIRHLKINHVSTRKPIFEGPRAPRRETDKFMSSSCTRGTPN